MNNEHEQCAVCGELATGNLCPTCCSRLKLPTGTTLLVDVLDGIVLPNGVRALCVPPGLTTAAICRRTRPADLPDVVSTAWALGGQYLAERGRDWHSALHADAVAIELLLSAYRRRETRRTAKVIPAASLNLEAIADTGRRPIDLARRPRSGSEREAIRRARKKIFKKSRNS